ncbi:MAG: hypothetical protein AAFV54_11865 [Pseudomonadota bacterium]
MKYSVFFVAIAAVVLTGCQTNRLNSGINSQLRNLGSPAQLHYPQLKQEKISKDKTIFRVDFDGVVDRERRERLHVLDAALLIANSNAEVSREVAGFLLGESDRVCDQFMARSNTNRNALTTALGSFALLTGAAATVTTGGQTANILSAIGAGALGSSQLYERNFFNERGAEIVLRALNNERRERKDLIIERLQGNHYRTLPATVLLADIEEYHAHCGIAVALSDLNDDAGEAADQRPVDEIIAAAQVSWCEQARLAGNTNIDAITGCMPSTKDASDAEPVEAEPVEAEPVEAEPVEAEPVEAEPVEADSAEGGDT